MRVIKIGGNELDKPDFIPTFANVLLDMAEPTVVVHGGGKGNPSNHYQFAGSPINGLVQISNQSKYRTKVVRLSDPNQTQEPDESARAFCPTHFG